MVVISHVWLFELKLNMEGVSGTRHVGQVFGPRTGPSVQRVLLDRPSPSSGYVHKTQFTFLRQKLVTVKLVGLRLKQNKQPTLKDLPKLVFT